MSIINYGVSKHYAGSMVSDRCPLGYLFVVSNLLLQGKTGFGKKVHMRGFVTEPRIYDSQKKHRLGTLEISTCSPFGTSVYLGSIHRRVATVREKVLENEKISRSGNSQGITFLVREI